jgi:hypothetical protein
VTGALGCAQLLLFSLFACSVDDRVLQPAKRSGQTEMGDNADPSMEDNSQRDGGSASSAPDLVDDCADLDTDGIADCKVTLVTTPNFTSDVEGWAAEGDAELSWDPKNALSDEPSGSAKLSGLATSVRALQCVPIEGSKLLIVYANVFVETGEADADDARALLEVAYFVSEDCSGASEGLFETPPSSETNAWTPIHAGGVSLDTTHSVSVTLIGIKSNSEMSQTVYFDNVMLTAQEP